MGCIVKLNYLEASSKAERIVYCMSGAAIMNALACACSVVLQALLHSVLSGVHMSCESAVHMTIHVSLTW